MSAEIIRSAADVTAMHLVAHRQHATSRAPDYWAGVEDALTWLCAEGMAPAVDMRWQLYVQARDEGRPAR